MRVQSIGAYYTLHGAAEALGVSYWQVARAVRLRQVPTLLLGQTLLVKLDDLRETVQTGAAAHAVSESLPEEASVPAGHEAGAARETSAYRVRGHVCPQCGALALAYEEGCQKCYACGYSAC
jgi:ribonucleoside-diphosphate reductase alpha chain